MTTSTDDQERQGARAARPSGDRRRRPLGRAVPDLLRLHRRGREPGRRRHVPQPATATGSTAGTSSRSRSGAQQRLRRPSYWGVPINVRDRAATALPGLFYDSLDDWGIDLAIVFPSVGLTLGRDIADPELEQRRHPGVQHDGRGPVRAVPRPHGAGRRAEPGRADRGDRADGARARSRPEGARHRRAPSCAPSRPTPSGSRIRRSGASTSTRSGVDSPYDYDPVWQKFVDLGIPVTSHSGSMGWPDRSLSSNFVGNHLGHFAQSHHTFARSLFLGGVTERFPTLNFGFLEGGVGWACNLYGDLFGHWEKRNRTFMDEHLKPTNLDTAEFRRLFEQYTAGNPRYAGKIDDIIAQNLDALESDTSQAELTDRDLDSDDFARVHIDGPDDIRRLFTRELLLRVRGRRPDDVDRVRREDGLAAEAVARLRHRALRRGRRHRGARGGVRARRGRPHHRARTSASSRSRTSCSSTGA